MYIKLYENERNISNLKKSICKYYRFQVKHSQLLYYKINPEEYVFIEEEIIT